MMKKTVIPDGYKSKLSVYDTQCAIDFIKKEFAENLSSSLCLKRVSAPLFVSESSGINDNLNGTERPVEFDIPSVGENAQIVHSLAKWKRIALKNYGFKPGFGIYTDMNAVRRDEELDNTHSVYVDQWDWEKIITSEERNIEYLSDAVKKIVEALCNTNDSVKKAFPTLDCKIEKNVTFITTQDLEDLYPELGPRERENLFVSEHRTVFLMQIGNKLKSGKFHDGRAPDYDDWTLNGDILIWNDVLKNAMEISSMGIRVNADSLMRQLELSECLDRQNLMFHKMLLANELPLTIGGGIGQSRMCMLIMETAHIGEVQVSIWDKHTIDECKKAGVNLL